MSILLVLIPLGLALTGAALWAFFWAVGSGQFDDLETPAASIFDEKIEPHLDPPTPGAAGGP